MAFNEEGFGQAFEKVSGWFVPFAGAHIEGTYERKFTVASPRHEQGTKTIYVIRLTKAISAERDKEPVQLVEGDTLGVSEVACIRKLGEYEFGTKVRFVFGSKRKTKRGEAWTLEKGSGVDGNKLPQVKEQAKEEAIPF